MNIGKAIKLCRNQRNLTKLKLAEKAELSVSYITLLEQGKRDPNLSTIEKICTALNIPTSILMFLATDAHERDELSTELSEKLSYLAWSLIGESNE
ncbi:hypothetical protein O1Q79_01874 [Lonepinella sp. MS14434]|uniref:helix-turn-helix domain-containing protein n=1 Tax=Lonepinella sp. MS14434 TaxID=3003617 RepID=UPI0036DE5481